jgi:acyl CoA:acetate/3-ketoacid CoA transferase alpha subunit/acyl CoA:acetate/3-ketoacid CoA transferase beta subunit
MISSHGLMISRFDTLSTPLQNKIMPLAQAIKNFVLPQMKINPVGRPSAAFYEICRQFRGGSPQFQYISSNLTGNFLPLVHLKLLKKVISSFVGDSYPTPGPSPIITRALERGELEIENWSMLTICQRLMAGALGVPFVTTKSLIDSSLGAELPHAFKKIDDPFCDDDSVGLIKAYHPDISIAHVWASDVAGNSISFPPFGENVYGALAARDGVIITAEHIVDTDFIRQYANLGRIPSGKVLSVSHVPYGAHPSGLYARNISAFKPYGNDYEFMKVHRKAQRTEESYEQWVKEWITEVTDHSAYLKKLSIGRLEEINMTAEPESWRADLIAHQDSLERKAPSGPIEKMVIHSAKEIAKRIFDNQYKTVLCGVGQATLASILAWHALRDRQYDFAIMAELGFYNYDPRPADPYVFNFRNIPSTTMLSDIFEILGIHTGGSTNQCLGVLGAAQIDRWGNVNSVRMDGKFIVGSGGANDITSASRQTIVVAQQGPGQFVKDVEHITCLGERIHCVVTTKGRFEKNDGRELVLTGYMAEPGKDEEASIRQIRELVDWDLQVSPDIERLDAPCDDDLLLLRSYDPERFFIGKDAKAE